MPAGPGGVDSNGVYLYGESDSASPVSDMLNLSAGSISTQFTNDRARLTSLETTAANPNVYVAASAAARDAKYGDPATLTATQRKALQDLGVMVYRTDLGITERFWALYNSSTNTIGANPYGWYPVPMGAGMSASRTNTSLSFPNSTWTIVSANSYSANGITLNSTTVPSTFTALYAGWYRLHVDANAAGWSSGAGTGRFSIINKNSTSSGTGVIGSSLQTASLTSYGVSLSVDAKLAVGDVIRFWLNQDSGGSATHNAINIGMQYLRPAQV
jgi:hypothetical protein